MCMGLQAAPCWKCSPVSDPVSSLAVVGRRPIPWWRWALLASYVLALIGLSVLARDPAWADWFDPARLSQRGHALLALPLGPVVVVLGYVLLVLMAVPVLALIVAGATVFGPWPGMAYSLMGMVAGATVAFAFGRFTGAQGMDRFTQGRLGLLSRHLHQRGMLTMALVRFMPVAPFMVVNLAAGALRVGWRDFVLGSALGLLPGTVVISLFTDQIVSAWQAPHGPASAWVAGAVAVAAAAGLWWWRRGKLRTRARATEALGLATGKEKAHRL
jgi:uncharacterized membrane protein YdjX (TVP38/TMEM64 family)